MPVQVIWDDAAQTVIRYRVWGYWTWDDFAPAIVEARALMAGLDHPISVIVDLTHSRTVPNFARWRGEQMGAVSPPNLKWVVMVGDDSLASLFDVFAHFMPAKARYARTLEEARALIAPRVNLPS